MMDAFGSSGYGIEQEYPDPPCPSFFNFEAEYNLTGKFGVDWTNLRLRRTSFGPITEDVDNSSFTWIFGYIILPLNHLSFKRFEFVVGRGLSFNSLTVNSSPEVEKFRVDKKVLGGCVRATFNYYLLKDFSMQFKVSGRFIPSIDISERIQENYIIKPHSVNFSTVDVSFRKMRIPKAFF